MVSTFIGTRTTTYRLLSKRLFLRNVACKRGTTRLRRTNETRGSISVAMFRPDFNRVFSRQRINSALQSRNIGSLSRRRRNRETRSYYVEHLYPFSFSSPSLIGQRIATDPRIGVIELKNNLQIFVDVFSLIISGSVTYNVQVTIFDKNL